MEKTFIFDLDDTLILNEHYYYNAKINLLYFIVEKLKKGLDLVDILKRHDEIDLDNVEKYGFDLERFPISTMQTFKELCENKKYPYTEDELKEAYEIGMQAYDVKPGLIKGASDVLEFLHNKKDELLLYTKGDKRVQQKKININNLYQWFEKDKIYIVGEKNSNDLEKIVGSRDKEQTYKVGNSIRSDINPALKVGIKTIYIPCETWIYESNHNGIDRSNPRVFVFHDIKEIIENYELL